MNPTVLSLSPREAYALWASSYDHQPNPLLVLEERTVIPLLPRLEGGAVLDVACGTARWLEQLVWLGARTGVGLDLSREMLHEASRKPVAARWLVEGDANELPVRDASIDFAICSFGPSYVADLGRFAKELSRIIRRDGTLLLTDFHPSASERGWKRRFRHGAIVIEISTFAHSLECIQQAFSSEGFELTVCLQPGFGEPERRIFEKAVKGELFEHLLVEPAIYVCLFRRVHQGSSLIRQKGVESEFGDRPQFRTGNFCVPAKIRCAKLGSVPEFTLNSLLPDEGPPKASLWLVGGRVASDSRTTTRANIEIKDGRIVRVVDANRCGGTSIDLQDYLILPGLINSHDHLEFNLFPRLGNGPYADSAAWARDIYQPKRSPLREHLSVPKSVRLWWGGLKNLLSGVTTVCHHNPYDPIFEGGFPVQVVRRYGWAHSLTFGQNVADAVRATAPDEPFMIHAGEGTDEGSQNEVLELDRVGALDHRTILIHGVAFSAAGHALRKQRGTALVWCPTSNRFLLGKTLDIRSIDCSDRIALGSDSALTAQGTLLDEITAAYEEGASADSIYSMVTSTAASILRLSNSEGRLQPGSVANLIAIPWENKSPAEAIVGINLSRVELVLVAGKLQLASSEVLARWPGDAEELEWISIEGLHRKVRAPVRWLLRETSTHLHDIRLAGQKVSA